MLDTKSLRDLADQGYGKAGAWLHKAADEIDRLREQLTSAYRLTCGPQTQDQMAAVRERLRKAMEGLSDGA